MTVINCLIVDDEPIARDILERYCDQLPYLKVVAKAANALEAKTFLQELDIDLLFLDINMPVLDGLSFLRTLRHPPAVIFTTAYREYALDAFDLAAVDYLLKPVSFDRFMIAVDKVLEKLQPEVAAGTVVAPPEQQQGEYLFIKSDGKIFRVGYNSLLYAEASGNYTRVVTDQQVILPAISFSSFVEQLPGSRFVRVHRSYIINISRISHIEGNRVYIGAKEIPIGSNYREGFLQQIGFRS